jgi:GntR family transcriptional regulator/MocR family aminotransferase
LKPRTGVTFAQAGVDASSPVPLHRQLYEQLREAILSRRLGPAVRFPSTRMLAAELGVSRNTVLNAYEQLLAEGYLEGRIGSGTYVARQLPDDLLCARAQAKETPRQYAAARRASRRGELVAQSVERPPYSGKPPRPFRSGRPDAREFPHELWAGLVARHWRHLTPALSGYGFSAGYEPLRRAIARYVGEARAVRCEPEQVIVVAGAQQGLDLTARVLLDAGDSVWFEEPGYVGARGAFMAAGARLVPVPVDREGLNVSAGVRLNESARMAYISPSHQYPLGVVMSLARRLELLDWAGRTGAWILEDDYDSEYRFVGRPLASLHGIDAGGSVIYLGTFSKVLLPTLRLAYLVVPATLVETFLAVRAMADHQSPIVEQMALAEFIAEGHFSRHIRRTRVLYAERQAALVSAAGELEGLLELSPSDAGLQLMGWLPPGVDDRAAGRAACDHDVDAWPLSSFCMHPPERGGLLLGYSAWTPREIREGARKLAAALRTVVTPKRRSAAPGRPGS